MAADVYLQEATKRLREASASLNDDIHTTQAEAYRTESQLHSDISRAEVERGEVRAEMLATPDTHLKVALEARVRQLDAEIRDKKAEVSRLGSDVARTVQAKNNLRSSIQSVLNQIESLVAAAK